MSGPGPYGPGRRSEPHEVPGGRRERQFGPDVSWPNGFQQLDPEARRLLESGYSASGSGRGQYDRVDPGRGAGGRGSGYRQPAMDDYGDPGYSDPAYDGPSRGSGGRTWPGDNRGPYPPGGSPVSDDPGYGGTPGYHVPDYREPARPDPAYQQGYAFGDLYPVTGAQEALPATGPQPIAEGWSGRESGSGRSSQPAYPEQWYDHPQLDDRRGGGSPALPPPAGDPRLEGMRYDELRYDEPFAGGPGGPGYDEPLDDESWVEELRRSAPSFPQPPGGQPGAESISGSISGPRRGDPRGPGYGQQPGYGPQPGPGPGNGNEQRQGGGYPQGFGYGQGRDDRGGAGPVTPRGPRMSAGPEAVPRPSALSWDSAPSGDAYYVAPTTQVGVLTPPAVRRLEEPVDSGPQTVVQPAVPSSSQLLAPPVRPGHGLDGPEITSSWPAQPQADDEQESFEEFWAEDDNDDEYAGLFPGEDADFDPRRKSARAKASRRTGTGRRRGRSSDHRLWLALLGVVVVAAGAIFGILKFEFPSQSGPTHRMATPARIGSYVLSPDMAKKTKLSAYAGEIIKMSAGQASNVVAVVYVSGNSTAGNTEQMVAFIGGHLANASPGSSIANFIQNFPGATVVSAGSLGGKAACVEEKPGTAAAETMCVFFDNDSFGEMYSPTMNVTALENVMRTMRPSLELVVPK